MPPIDLGFDFGDEQQQPDTSFSAPGDAFNDGPGDFEFDAGQPDL